MISDFPLVFSSRRTDAIARSSALKALFICSFSACASCALRPRNRRDCGPTGIYGEMKGNSVAQCKGPQTADDDEALPVW